MNSAMTDEQFQQLLAHIDQTKFQFADGPNTWAEAAIAVICVMIGFLIWLERHEK